MSLKHGLLGLLQYGSMTGYELDKAFKSSLSFFWQAKTSQIYRELDAMEGKGWLISQRIFQQEKPNKRVYTITDVGKRELRNWLPSPEGDIADAMGVRSGFLMRVFFGGEMSNQEALALLRAYRKKCLESRDALLAAHDAMAEYGPMVKDDRTAKFWNMTLAYGEAFHRAGLEWAEQSIAFLEEEQP